MLLKERVGLSIVRSGDRVTYMATDDEVRRLDRNFMFMAALQNTGIVPKIYHKLEKSFTVEYVEETPIISIDKVKASAALVLSVLTVRNIRHGDLTKPNFVITNDSIVLLDFGESRYGWEHNIPDKRFKSDRMVFSVALRELGVIL